jgi:hypothetical protein
MTKGIRWIDGKQFLLAGMERSKEAAQREADTKRARGHEVRIIKRSEVRYLIYAF